MIPVSNDKFWIRPWLPQVAILAHPAISGGLTHCGLGGTNEFISMGVPAVLWPHFLDQHHNAKCLRDSGLGINLFEKQRITNNVNELVTYEDPVFTKEDVTRVFQELLTNSKYKKAAMKLKIISRLTGGRDLAVRTIENHYIAGCDHLIDKNLIKNTKNLNFFKFWLIMGVIFGLGLFSIKKYY